MNTSPNPNDFYKQVGASGEEPTQSTEPTDGYREEPTQNGEGHYFDYTEAYRAAPQYGGEPQEEPSNGLGVASFVLGLIGYLLCSGCMPPISIVAIVLAAMDRKKAMRWRGMAIAGLVFGIIGLVSTLIMIGVFAFVIFIEMSMLDTYALQMLLM